MPLEIAWTLIPTVICAGLFIWASSLYFENSRPPSASTEIFVIGKQWMWHIQHPEGPREINELHVPVNVPVKLTMTSEDVIHDFYIPAFRVKKDVLPGRLTLAVAFRGHEDRHVPSLLRAVLRRGPCRNDRLGLCDDAIRLCRVACGQRAERFHGAVG